MRYIGAALVIFAAALIASGYRDRLSREVNMLGELLSLIRYIRSRVTHSLEPPEVWAAGFKTECEPLSMLVRSVAEGVPVSDAYARASVKLALPDDVKETVSELFTVLGELDIDSDGRALAAAEGRLADILDARRSEVSVRGRLAMAIALLLSVGGAIVII